MINYGSGFTASGLQLNGSTTLNGTRLRLTDGGEFEASSAFYTTPVNVQSFTTNFSFQMTSASADGMAFVIQNGAATSLGLGGGGLGYEDIGNSVAVKFDIYSNAGEGTDSTGMYINGAIADGTGGGHDEFGSNSAERRRDECAAQLQRDNADVDDHGCDHVEAIHDQLDGEHSDDGGQHDSAGGVHGRLGRVDGDSGRSELDLRQLNLSSRLRLKRRRRVARERQRLSRGNHSLEIVRGGDNMRSFTEAGSGFTSRRSRPTVAEANIVSSKGSLPGIPHA